MTAAVRYTREQILALPPASTLADLAGCLGVSEPVVRQLNRSGQLERMGIKINKFGAQWRVITSSVWQYLGIGPASGASIAPAGRNGAGQDKPTASALRLAEAASGRSQARHRPPAQGGARSNGRRGSSATGA